MGWGFHLCLDVVGKIDRFQIVFFFLGIEVDNNCNEISTRWHKLKGRDVAFVSDWLTRKMFSQLV